MTMVCAYVELPFMRNF